MDNTRAAIKSFKVIVEERKESSGKAMAQAVNLSLPHRPPSSLLSPSKNSSYLRSFDALCAQLRCSGRVTCLFNDNRKQEQAKKALESALGGNKEKFEKWNQEIKKREEIGGGGSAGGGGGWFGWGGRFGWFNGDNFWQDAQQTILTILGMVVLYLLVAKGELLLAVILNPLLFALRSTRNALGYVMSRLTGKSYSVSDAKLTAASLEPANSGAKSRVMNKWGTD